jgi:predicted Zn finger-like uncharacterized protein
MNGAVFTRGDIHSVFTQCSKCETVFKLSAEVLRAAGGQVRCGKCGEIFNALAHLAEDPSVFTAGETSFDLETRADSILQTPAPPRSRGTTANSDEFAAPGVEIARLQILDWNESEVSETPEPPGDDADELGESSMEFTLPPGELDRIFVETKKGARPRVPPPAPVPAATRAPSPAPAPAPIVDLAEPEEIEVFNAAAPDTSAADFAAPPQTAAPESAPAARSGFEVPEEVRREMLLGVEAPDEAIAELERPGRPVRRRVSPFDSTPSESERLSTPWLIAAVAAGALLAMQVIHQNREWLAAHAPLGGSLRALYSKMGAPVTPPANLTAYQLRQWGVTGDPAGEGTLRVRASILNTAAQLEPYPLLRVTLANRFGASIGTRDFEPSEYLGKPTAKLLAPGERTDATLDILDPGKSAEGFEIDVCLRAADRRVACANDKAPAQAKR